jgi:hypothetical protein
MNHRQKSKDKNLSENFSAGTKLHKIGSWTVVNVTDPSAGQTSSITFERSPAR